MQETKRYILQFIRFSLFFIFAGYYFSISAFYHSHLVDGVLITHSHPIFDFLKHGSGTESHSHSASSLQNIQQLSEISCDLDSVHAMPSNSFGEEGELVTTLCSQPFSRTLPQKIQLRAPPASSLAA